VCVLIFFKNLSKTLLILRRNESDMIKMCIDLHVKYPLFLYDFNENRIFSKVCRKYPNINYYENPHRGSQVVPRGQTDMKQLVDVFCNLRMRLKTMVSRKPRTQQNRFPHASETAEWPLNCQESETSQPNCGRIDVPVSLDFLSFKQHLNA